MSTAFSAPPTEETGITTRTAGVNIIPDEFGELPGAGGAPEIAGYAREVLIIIRQNPRSFVQKLDFITTV